VAHLVEVVAESLIHFPLLPILVDLQDFLLLGLQHFLQYLAILEVAQQQDRWLESLEDFNFLDPHYVSTLIV